MVLLDISFEGSVLSRSQSRWRPGFSKRNDVVIDEVLVVAGRVGIKFVFRNLLAVVPGHRHLLPMEVKVGCVDEIGRASCRERGYSVKRVDGMKRRKRI